MKCPFELPIGKPFESGNYQYSMTDGKGVFRVIIKGSKVQANYARKAIHSHEKLVVLLKMAQCPNCDGSGAILRQVSERRYVTRDMASDAGDMALEGSLYSDDVWEAELCQWCDERRQALSEAEKP